MITFYGIAFGVLLTLLPSLIILVIALRDAPIIEE
jgi:hypothetical protein